jgi:Holliday junction resolvase-like predicted endonuclease
MTDPAKMGEILDLLTPDEVEHTLHFVEVMERAGHLDAEEAEEWRRRIGAW